MALPFFYISEIPSNNLVQLPEDSSKHIVQVLRMQEKEKLHLTDGLGHRILAEITDANRKKCILKMIDNQIVPAAPTKNSIAISPLKNNHRFEWFLEKATELGMNEIVPLICERTEKQFIKKERLQNILVSAMLQSQQCYLPVLHDPIAFDRFVETATYTKKYIAHCESNQSRTSFKERLDQSNAATSLILIGPEGDFSSAEIQMATAQKFEPVSLGNTRLRTETAGMAAAVLMTNRPG